MIHLIEKKFIPWPMRLLHASLILATHPFGIMPSMCQAMGTEDRQQSNSEVTASIPMRSSVAVKPREAAGPVSPLEHQKNLLASTPASHRTDVISEHTTCAWRQTKYASGALIGPQSFRWNLYANGALRLRTCATWAEHVDNYEMGLVVRLWKGSLIQLSATSDSSHSVAANDTLSERLKAMHDLQVGLGYRWVIGPGVLGLAGSAKFQLQNIIWQSLKDHCRGSLQADWWHPGLSLSFVTQSLPWHIFNPQSIASYGDYTRLVSSIDVNLLLNRSAEQIVLPLVKNPAFYLDCRRMADRTSARSGLQITLLRLSHLNLDCAITFDWNAPKFWQSLHCELQASRLGRGNHRLLRTGKTISQVRLRPFLSNVEHEYSVDGLGKAATV